MGATEIRIGYGCATEVLPRLIADAVFRQNFDTGDAHRVLIKIEAEY